MELKAIVRPSGDQSGPHASLRVRFRGSDPSAFITKIRDVPSCGQCRYAISEPSGDHVGSNSMTADDVSRRTCVPSAHIHQMSFVSSENTILPVSDLMSIGADEA